MNILLTSAGRRTYLINYFKAALKGEGLVYASNSVMTYSLSQADKYVLTPQIYDDSYIDFLLEYCRIENIKLVISLFDIDLPILAKNKSRFDEFGITVIVSDEHVTAICNDKWMTYEFLKSVGLNCPFTFKSLETAQAALNDGLISFPLIIKPRWGMGSIGVIKVENEEELDVLYKKIKRDIFSTYLKYESSASADECVIIQEFLKGKEFGLDVLNDLQGNYVTTIAKEKIAMRAGETDVAQIVDNAPFIKIGITLSENLKHLANLDVDCFVDAVGNVYVLELNCRFGGQYPFSHNAGVDFPRQIILWRKGIETDMSLLTPKIGVISCKDLNPVICDYE